MTARTRLVALLCAAAALLSATATTAPALAASNPILKQCQSHGQLSGQFTLAQLRHALSILPTELKQYTNCQDVIQQAILAAKRPGGHASKSGSGSGGSFLPTPVIIALVVLILAAVTFGALAVRRRRADADAPGDGDGPAGRGPPAPPAI